MAGTLFSLVVAIYLFLNPIPEIAINNSTPFVVILFIIGTLIILIAALITLFAWVPLQLAEQNSTPGVIRSFLKDRRLRGVTSLIILFIIATYAIAIDLLFLHQFNSTYLLVGWTIGLGLTFDLVFHLMHRVMSYFDPQHVVDFFGQQSLESIRKSDFKEICGWLDSFSVIAMKAAANHNSSLCLSSIDKMRSVAKSYLAVAKSITFHDEDTQGDHVNYTLFYLFQRVEMIYEAALRLKLEPICSHIITMLGKITIYSAKFDISVAHYPLYYLGKLTEAAQRKGLEEVGNRATLTMLEVGKVIIKEVDIQYVDIKETFFTLINNMHVIAQEIFRKDKSISISLLTKPFYDLKDCFQNPRVSSHQDTPLIIQQINQVINEFNTLETVMSTMPPIPEMEKEKEKIEKAQETPDETPGPIEE